MKLSERLEDYADGHRRLYGDDSRLAATLREAAALARRVEDAEVTEPAMQAGTLVSVTVRDGGHYKGQRVRLVPEAGQGGGE